ncbi:MAG: response regulator transcription factor [Candidatus Pacebacteria bacterium]|nr:response regulator transcription factor [Candidatus Paceibacterota bacterium]
MKILIIEDDEVLVQMLKTGLGKEGYAVDYLTDGEAGERRLELHYMDYDLIILDLMLPKKDGAEICKNIRKKGITVPILILTAKADTEEKIHLLDEGADDYLVKPFAFPELLARMRAIIRRPAKMLAEELTVSDLMLNSLTQRVHRGAKEISLTLKEFRLLEYLMRHPNQVINRDQILDNLWDFDFSSFSNVVDVHIKNLRKKIGNNHSKMIETIRGVGYRLKGE